MSGNALAMGSSGRDLSMLDGAPFTAISVTHAHGCGGWEPCDEIDGMTVFVRPGHIDDSDEGDLERLEDRLGDLWPSRGAAAPRESQRAAAAALGIELPIAALEPMPLWRADFPGTLADYLKACDEYRAAKTEAGEELNAAFLRARLALLRDQGFTPVGVKGLPCRTIVHDYGCRCMCWSGSGGDANQALAVRDGAVYAAAPGADLDALLAESVNAGDRAHAAAVAKNVKWAEKATVPGTGIDEYQLSRDPGNPILAMTWQQWDEHRRSVTTVARQKAAQGVASGDWTPLIEYARAGWGQYSGVQDPDARRRYAAHAFLCQSDVKPLDAASVTALWSALLPGVPLPDGVDAADGPASSGPGRAAAFEDEPILVTRPAMAVRGAGRLAPPVQG